MIKYLLSAFCVFSFSLKTNAQEEAEAVKIICTIDDFKHSGTSNFRESAIAEIEGEKTANFEVTYIDVPENAKFAIQKAIDIWSRLITSKMPIRVLVNWVTLGERNLASAGSTKIFRNAPGLPLQNTWYVAPLAEALLEKELNSGDIDIEIKVNSTIRWAYIGAGIKGNEFDLTTVILHEIAHALGVSSSFDVSADNTKGFWGNSQQATLQGYYAFDYFIENGSNKQLINDKYFKNNSAELQKELVSNNLFFSLKRGFLAGDKIKLFAPLKYIKGSSISHFDETAYSFNTPNSLLTPNIAQQEINYYIGDLLLNCLHNLGWKVALPDIKLVVKEITAFPNPIIDELNVQFPYNANPREVEIDLLSMWGVLLETKSNKDYAPTVKIKFTNYPSGIYLLKILDNEVIRTMKVVKL